MSTAGEDGLSSQSIDSDSLDNSESRSSINSDLRDIITRLELSDLAVGEEAADESGISTGESSGANSPSISAIKEDEQQNGEATGDEESNGGSASLPGEAAPYGVLPVQGIEQDEKGEDQRSSTAEDSQAKVKKSRRSSLGGFFKRLSFSKESRSEGNQTKRGKPSKGTVMTLQVKSLPQLFITKYLGCRVSTGLWGPEHTRAPIDAMMDSVRSLLEQGNDLPLVKLQITEKGIDVSEHKANSGGPVDSEQVPIEYISYGVQDAKYKRVFAFITVKEMSWRAKKMECHGYICDSALTARRLSLSIALAFKIYSSTLQGKSLKFGIDFNTEQEIIPKEPTLQEGNECDA